MTFIMASCAERLLIFPIAIDELSIISKILLLTRGSSFEQWFHTLCTLTERLVSTSTDGEEEKRRQLIDRILGVIFF